MPQNPPKTLQDAVAQGGKPVPAAPPTLDAALSQGGKLGKDPSFWEKTKAFSTTPRIPA
jgi:hypothetical protein